MRTSDGNYGSERFVEVTPNERREGPTTIPGAMTPPGRKPRPVTECMGTVSEREATLSENMPAFTCYFRVTQH